MIADLTFGGALEHIKADSDCRMSRVGWNGKDQYIYLHKATTDIHVDFLMIRTSSGKLGPYVASNCDTLATDWHILP